MSFSIRKKLFVLLAGLTAVVLTGVLSSVSSKLGEAILKKVEHDFKQSDVAFKRERKLRAEKLLESATLFGESTSFKANVKLNDTATVYEFVNDLSRYVLADLFVVTDDSGRLLAWWGDPDRHGEDLTSQASVARALEGEVWDPRTLPELWFVDEGLFQIATVPVWLNDEEIIGTITLGSLLTQVEAREMKGESQIDITFISGDDLIGSTVEELSEQDLADLRTNTMYQVQEVMATAQASDLFEGDFDGHDVFAFISPLGTGEPAYYVATARKSTELAILHDIQGNIYVTAGLSLVITILLALILGRTLTRPVLRLVQGMNQVKEGDLSVRLKASTRDEIGLLTDTFNDMIVNLRERLQLMKYVGSHTMEMIEQASDGDVPLGGARRELAVMFTDIRGFTAYSEHRTPEEVISMLNRYLGFQAEIVPTFGGSIDKFVGDEMMALFIGEDALKRASSCAIEIQRRVEEEHKSDPAPISIGIGINYGPVILGNMGAQNRLDYTAIGATVNLGSRLCSAAAPGQILIRGELCEGLATVSIKGRSSMSFKGFSDDMDIADISVAEGELKQ
jgi:class 3 adenylate cyclase